MGDTCSELCICHVLCRRCKRQALCTGCVSQLVAMGTHLCRMCVCVCAYQSFVLSLSNSIHLCCIYLT